MVPKESGFQFQPITNSLRLMHGHSGRFPCLPVTGRDVEQIQHSCHNVDTI